MCIKEMFSVFQHHVILLSVSIETLVATTLKILYAGVKYKFKGGFGVSWRIE